MVDAFSVPLNGSALSLSFFFVFFSLLSLDLNIQIKYIYINIVISIIILLYKMQTAQGQYLFCFVRYVCFKWLFKNRHYYRYQNDGYEYENHVIIYISKMSKCMPNHLFSLFQMYYYSTTTAILSIWKP